MSDKKYYSNCGSIEEQRINLYNEFVNAHHNKTQKSSTDITNNHNISITMTNKLNFITSIYNEVNAYRYYQNRYQ